MREEFVRRALGCEKSKAALCREYGISRPTGDKWIARYLRGDSLDDRSRRPFHTPGKVSADAEERIVDLRKTHPAIGALKLRRMLENELHTGLPSAKTVNNILKRNGLITREASLAATPVRRFEKSCPNEMWQSDYKGHFLMKNSERCHPLNIIDDHSRFCLCCEPQRGETFQELRPVMIRLFERFGLPFSFLCDNGNPWGTAQSTGFSRFEVWMMEQGILVLHGRVRHPQTQGKDESFNRSMTRELLRHAEIADFEDAGRRFGEYRDFYNNKRPHHALGLETPAQRYERSGREYKREIAVWEYPEDCQVRSVKESGFFHYKGQGYFLSESFGGKEIAIHEAGAPGCVTLMFRQFRIGCIDIDKRVFTSKRAYLLRGDPRDQPPIQHAKV